MSTNVKADGTSQLGRLRLENCRAVKMNKLAEVLNTEQAAWFKDYCGDEGEFDDANDNDHMSLQCVDVVDVRTGKVVHEFLLWHWMDGIVVQAGTTTRIAAVVQHSARRYAGTSKAWLVDFARAWWEGAPRLGMNGDAFSFDNDELGNYDAADDV